MNGCHDCCVSLGCYILIFKYCHSWTGLKFLNQGLCDAVVDMEKERQDFHFFAPPKESHSNNGRDASSALSKTGVNCNTQLWCWTEKITHQDQMYLNRDLTGKRADRSRFVWCYAYPAIIYVLSPPPRLNDYRQVKSFQSLDMGSNPPMLYGWIHFALDATGYDMLNPQKAR